MRYGPDDICRNRHGGADTSIEAFDSVKQHISRLGRVVLQFFKDHGPSTCEQIEHALKLSHQCASARISELKRDALIYQTGQFRPTKAGRKARVYAVRITGREQLALI